MSSALLYPLDRHREVQRQWRDRLQQPRAVRAHPLPQKADHKGGGRCPACNAPASIAPNRSVYRGGGRIDHHWLCRGCGHEWTTSLHVQL